MAVQLPLPGQEPWDQDLNAAITGLDVRLVQVENSGDGDGGGGAEGRMAPLFVFTGESNSGGQAQNSQATPAEVAPRACVQIFDNIGLSSFLTLDIGTNNNLDHWGLEPTSMHGWELQLANSVEAGEWWDGTVHLVKTGQGGTKLYEWHAASTYYTKFVQRVANAQAILRSQGKVPLIFLWVSWGINDAISGTPVNTFMTQLDEMFVRMRGELGFVPIVMAKNMASSPGAVYNDALDAYAASDNMFFTVDPTGCATDDVNHWSYAGMKELSLRMQAASKNFGQHEGFIESQITMLSGGRVSEPPVITTPSIIRSPSSLSFVEGGAGASFTVKLSIQPAADVVVAVAAAGGNVNLTASSLTFTTGNWNTTQSVTATSPNDGASSGNRNSTITLSSAGVTASATVTVVVTDATPAPSAPVNSALPAITGATTLGALLTCSTGTWTQSPTSYAYQWKRGGTSIAGETAATHTIVAADQGTTLTCTVTATNANGSTAATSAGAAIPAAPSSFVLYTWQDITGLLTVDGQGWLIASPGAANPAGANAVEPVDAAQPFRIIIELPTAGMSAVVTMLDDDRSTNFVWGGQAFTTCAYYISGNVYNGTSSSDSPTWGWTPAFPLVIKMEKSGDDVIYSASTSVNGPWTQRYTHTGALTGKTTQYVRVCFASASEAQKVRVTHDSLLQRGGR